MVNSDYESTTNFLPAIIIGGAPDSGKSVLTYNITRALREHDVPHYVFRANPDGQGDWLFQSGSDSEDVRQLYVEGKWSDEFRTLVQRDISRRLLPLIVDIGGKPDEKDHGIFQACKQYILLLKDDEQSKAAIETWRRFTTGLTPIAEIHSQLGGVSELTSTHPMIEGSIAFGERREKRIHGDTFDALVERIAMLFQSYSLDELEQLHMQHAPVGFEVVNLERWLERLAPGVRTWSPNLLEPLFSKLPEDAPLAIYGRAPVWLYGALALHAPGKQFYQFDPRLGWIKPPRIEAGTLGTGPQVPITLERPRISGKKYMLTVKTKRYYLDYTEAHQLAFPEVPPAYGVIVNGKLPLWLFTALARFYAQRNVRWIALRDAAEGNKAFVISSPQGDYDIGERITLPM